VLTFRDIVVVPYSDLLTVGPARSCHRGGPLWPDFDRQLEARHQRKGEPVDHEPERQPAGRRLSGRWAWAGPISGHFGHQLVEFSMRLMPTLAHDPAACFLFGASPGGRPGSIDDAPPFFRSVLDWLGIPTTRCEVVTSPVVVDELVVAPQAEQLGGPVPSGRHLEAMDALTHRRLGPLSPRDVVYVSRAGMHARFAGEASLEEALTRCGVRVVRPETRPLAEQLEIYASARQLIFAEGSSVYGPLLLGRVLGDVTVLQRRAGSTLGRPALGPRSATLRYRDAIADAFPGRTWRGDLTDAKGVTVLDEDALLETFDGLGIPLRDHWDPRAYAEGRDADVQAHLDLVAGKVPSIRRR
jgi:hypothetical protein